jgi:hypothetical protein
VGRLGGRRSSAGLPCARRYPCESEGLWPAGLGPLASAPFLRDVLIRLTRVAGSGKIANFNDGTFSWPRTGERRSAVIAFSLTSWPNRLRVVNA